MLELEDMPYIVFHDTKHTEDVVSVPDSLKNICSSAPPDKLPASNSVPPELLELIFQQAIPPYALLDTTLYSGDQSPWSQSLRLMKSITLVCRSWYHVGVQFLYENICIRRFPQLQHLHETLAALETSSSLKNLAILVKSLDIQCHIPQLFASEFDSTLRAIMKLCPSISTFGYTSPCYIPPPGLQLTCLKPHVTHLRLQNTMHYVELVSILRDLQHQLLVLHVKICHRQYQQYREFYSEDPNSPFCHEPAEVALPSLHTLSVTTTDKLQNLNVLDVLQEHWAMPALERFTIYINFFIYNSRAPNDSDVVNERDLRRSIVDFLSTHGRALRLLHIGIPYFWIPATHFKKVLGHCPLLERLVMHPATFRRVHWECDEYFHANLRWLDFTHNFCNKSLYTRSSLALYNHALPSLEKVRHLCNLPVHLTTWVDDFDPSLGVDGFTIEMFHHQLVYGEGTLLYKFEQDVKTTYAFTATSGSFSLWEEASSDSEYLPHSEASSDSSSSEGSSDEWTSESGDDDASTFSN